MTETGHPGEHVERRSSTRVGRLAEEFVERHPPRRAALGLRSTPTATPSWPTRSATCSRPWR